MLYVLILVSIGFAVGVVIGLLIQRSQLKRVKFLQRKVGNNAK